ncbi:MAG: hypothetical protein R2713_14175 [Ilumatobacteraceae bacterium]
MIPTIDLRRADGASGTRRRVCLRRLLPDHRARRRPGRDRRRWRAACVLRSARGQNATPSGNVPATPTGTCRWNTSRSNGRSVTAPHQPI